MVFPGARLFRAPIWCSSGGGGMREAGSTVAESLVALYRVGTHQIRQGRRAARSSTSQGSAEPLRARIKGTNREVSEGKAGLDHDLFFSYEGRQGAANGQDSLGFFQGCIGLWTAGCWLARRLHQLKASTTMDLGIVSRVLSKFSPFRWSKWRWQAFSSFKRTAQVFVMIAVTMLLELNAFMLMNALEIPKNFNFNVIRITVIFFLGLLASNEYYEYCSNPNYDRLGQNAWLVLAIMQMEILLWVKFFPQPLMNASSPPEVKLPWLATLGLFSLWGMLFFAVSEDRMAALRGKAGMSVSHDSSNSLLDADGSANHVDVGGGGDGNGGVTNGATSGRGDAATDSVKPASTKQKSAMLVAKWGLVDAGFVLSFMPLLYLVKQWSY